MTDLPGDIGGSNPLKIWLNKIKTAIKRRTLLPGLGYKLHQHESGVALEILNPGGGVGSLRTYLVKEKIGDVLICRSWDGTTEGTEDVPVAVNRNSRQLGGETIAGTAYTYSSYTAIDGFNDSRNSGDGSTNETQIVTPMWYLDCEIDVMATNYSGVTFDDTINPPYDLKLIEVSARCWAKVEE